ncbi:MAG: hypothetical protein SOY07_03000 [Bacteroidales bacterium]|nr:hypothetical protein [Bacteroidales bacterium]
MIDRPQVEVGLQLAVCALDLAYQIVVLPRSPLVESADVGAQEVDAVAALKPLKILAYRSKSFTCQSTLAIREGVSSLRTYVMS